MAYLLDSPLSEAVGAAPSKSLDRAFSMKTVGDLLTHYPRRYADPGELTPIRDLPTGETVTIVAEVLSSTVRRMRNRNGAMLEVIIGDGIGRMSLTFFAKGTRQAEWRQNDLAVGRRGVFSGKVGVFNNTTQFAHPQYELFEDADAAQRSADARANVPIPIYPATSALQTWQIAKFVALALDGLGEVPDPLPDDVRAREGLLTAREALERIHRPPTRNDIDPAVRTLRMHEALTLQTALLQQRDRVRALTTAPRRAKPGGLLERFDASLPFTLTPDQQQVGEQVAEDLTADHPMNRLVQGEVGSGKTLVALRAMLQVAESGGQAALIAPTEVLAGQHLRSITKMLGPQLAPEVMPTLLTGQMSAPERRKAALRVASGQSLIVIGTHALLSDKTTFADLGLVVVDEQHRFGVEQREALRAKGTSPHALVLTATPIPRTVAMTVFGDLDTSVIRSMPAGRVGIETFVAPLADHPGWFQRVWQRASEEISQGRQVFAVCAAIDTVGDTAEADGAPPADADADARGPRWGVVQLDEALATHPTLSGVRRAVLHGRMPADEKDAVMQAFARGEIDLLVATTVIEVELEHAEASVAFSSGMAAMTAAILSHTAAVGKSHVVAVRPLYGGTDHLLDSGLLGTAVTFCEQDEVAEALRPETGLVVLETPANPTLDLVDIRHVVSQAGEVPVLVDNTFATPLLQNPLDLGASMSLHSATKYIGGHGDVIAGVIACAEPTAAALRRVRAITGALLHPLGAYLLHRGLATLPVRMERQQRSAARMVDWLSEHPAVSEVFYPGSHDPRGLVGTQMRGSGAMIAVRLRGGYAAAEALTGTVSLFTHAVSLGGVDSLIQHPAALTHRPVAAEARPGADIVRLSIGLEDPEDLISDLEHALARAQVAATV